MTFEQKEKTTPPITVSIIIRSLVINVYFYLSLAFFIIFILTPLSLLKSPKPMRSGILVMINSMFFVFEKIGNIKIVERGRENIPAGKGFIYCSKHMSNLDALFLFRSSPNLTALAKRELFRVPLLNLIFHKMGVLAINRGAGEAQKQTPEIAKIIYDKKLPMIIFAEGTRILPGDYRPLKSGIFYYQQEEDLDIIAVSHNSGVHYQKKSFIKLPGTIVVEYHPAMPKALSKDDFMAELERRVIDRSNKLML